jgi:lysozyme
MRKISADGIKELQKMESVEPYVYTDSAGYQTIGVGHKITPHELESGLLLIDGNAVRWIDGLSAEQIDGLMRQDLAAAEWTVESLVKVPLTDNQFAALTSFVFNCGTEAFKGSSVLRVLNQGNYNLVPNFLLLWNKITVRIVDVDGLKNVKKVSQGLVNRREKEIALWLKP